MLLITKNTKNRTRFPRKMGKFVFVSITANSMPQSSRTLSHFRLRIPQSQQAHRNIFTNKSMFFVFIGFSFLLSVCQFASGGTDFPTNSPFTPAWDDFPFRSASSTHRASPLTAPWSACLTGRLHLVGRLLQEWWGPLSVHQISSRWVSHLPHHLRGRHAIVLILILIQILQLFICQCSLLTIFV